MKLNNIETKRLILIDLDGTALKNDGINLHPKTKTSLIKAKKNGHDVCIITGRPFRASKDIYNELGLSTLMCNFDGGHIHDPNNKSFNRIILPISEEIVFEILNSEVIKNSISNLIVESHKKSIIMNNDQELIDYFHLDTTNDECELTNPYDNWKGPATNIVLIIKNNSLKDEVIRVLDNFKHSIKIQIGGVFGNLKTNKNISMITLTNKIVDKGFAAKILAQYYNKDLSSVIAFGDALNDWSLIKNVGYGIAMKNGEEQLKNIARGITFSTNEQGGLGEYLDKLLAGESV